VRRPACPLALPAALTALALLAGGCGSGNGAGSSSSQTSSASTPSGASPVTGAAPRAGAVACRKLARPGPRPERNEPKPKGELAAGKAWTAQVSTSCGSFTIALDTTQAPRTAASFASLARAGFYDGLDFHRVSPGFVIQGGDPRGDGSGGPGYSVVEPPPSGTRYTRGTVAMAKTETEAPGTSGSQFFIVTADDASGPPFSLPADYAVVGKVTKGLDVVEHIGEIRSDPQTEQPVEPVVISRVRIRRR
jgi:cyclophilin family peptidyl-prolyl cis-trans isomerase